MSSAQHLAAILTTHAGGKHEVKDRPTPTPGPDDLLIEVSSIALNPIDVYHRDMGYPPLAGYPSIVGSDIAGTVISAGAAVASDAPTPGTRVAAFAPAFFVQGAPDYGALQKKVLVPAVNATALPPGMGFNEAALLPMAVVTTWAGWYTMGIARDTAYTPEDKKGMLVWGGASSIGSGAIQVAKLMGFTVYATASPKHHEYLKSLGASKCFDYKSEDVVGSIVKAVKDDGVTVNVCFDAVGSLKECQEILAQTKGPGTAKIASAIPLQRANTEERLDGVEVAFVAAPPDAKQRTEQFHFVMNVWLKEKLAKGEFVPSPRVKVVEGGLYGVDKGLDELKGGVSGTKLVLEV